MFFERIIKSRLERTIERGKSVLLLGPRQTGKTTLLSNIQSDLSCSLLEPSVRQRYEKDPNLLNLEIKTLSARLGRKVLVFLDEIQKIPELLDVAQNLHDLKIAQFILTGSSARKLKRGKVNLLPGRVVVFHLDPLALSEIPKEMRSLESQLLYGSLPGILLDEMDQDREEDLRSYVETYIEDEIRAESVVRNLSSFARFVELAASESGNVINFQKLSKQIGVANSTIASYYQILEDCLILERIEPISESKTRLKLTRSQKFLFFDLGVRRVAAKEGAVLPFQYLGALFEQWVGLELLRTTRLTQSLARLRFWRDPDGPEVDWVVEKGGTYIPIEVKYSENPSFSDARHLETFMKEYSNAQVGFIVCRTPQAYQISERVTAISYRELSSILS